MKSNILIIPALFVSLVNLQAQKSVHPFATNNIVFERAIEGDNSHQRNMLIPNGNLDNIHFVNCWIKPMDKAINSSYPDYTPVLNGKSNMMYFTSRRPENIGNGKTIDRMYKAEDIYYSHKDTEGKWSEAVKISGGVNSRKNEAVTWLSADGTKMILCKNEDLYESELVNNAWTKPSPIKAVNSEYRETHASFSPDGNTLFFTTDNPSEATVGGLDICMVQRDASGQWGAPTLVENINSPLNEEDPTLMADGKTFYFSSQGFGSMGGYDIFKTIMNDDGVFATPENIGFPINTEGNEPFISMVNDGKKAIFSSDRGNETGEQNIYEVTFTDYIKVPLLVEVYDADTKELLNSNVQVVNAKRAAEVIYMDNVTPGVFGGDDLSLGTHYNIHADAKGYSSADISLSTVGIAEFNPDTFKLVQKIYLKADPKEVIIDEMVANIVHFDFGKSTLKSESILIVNKIKDVLKSNPSTHIIINAHTDDKGSNAANYQLSNHRANAVKDWFVQQGIDLSRIVIKGFGEEQPVVINSTDANRAKNRRAEIVIVK